jgi:hypothetical protein
MSVPFGPVVLTLDDITHHIRRTFEQFTDLRQGKNTRYTLVDAGLSAFSVFFMQSPSFLEYQRAWGQVLSFAMVFDSLGLCPDPYESSLSAACIL